MLQISSRKNYFLFYKNSDFTLAIRNGDCNTGFLFSLMFILLSSLGPRLSRLFP